MPRSERFHFLVVCSMVIDGNRWRREREEFMHPRYARVRETYRLHGEDAENPVKSDPKPNLYIWSAVPI